MFGDGAKLLEFGDSSEGMLLAFAMLTATGNGDGSGDICRTAYSSQGKLYEPRTGERIHYERQQDYDHTHKQLLEGETCGFRIMMPAMAGRWAGDRIVTAGDSTPAWQFMTRTQQLGGMQLALTRRAHYIRNEYKREPTDEDFESVTSNIYHYASRSSHSEPYKGISMMLLSRTLAIVLVLTIVAGCSGDSSSASKKKPSPSTWRAAKPKERKSPFKLIKSARQNVGNWRNTLDLYALEGVFDNTAFEKICKEKWEDPQLKDELVGFHFIVVFDKAENVKLPTHPFTALYDGEEDLCRHIIATFRYYPNDANKLCVYFPRNKWESLPVVNTSFPRR